MTNIPETDCPLDVTVYDRGSHYMDRFTVFMPDGSVFCMSTNACSPIGICRYEGQHDEVPLTNQDVLRKSIPLHVNNKIEELRV